jgi:4-hydroxyphenylpyruvate dioxygenase
MNYEKPTKRPVIGKFYGFDHIVFWVGNAKQAAAYYTSRFGFEYLAYRGLETGERNIASHVIKRNRAIFEFQSSYDPKDGSGIGEHVKIHGDGVKDIAFEVEDCTHTFNIAKSRGARVVREVETLSDDYGIVIRASVQTYNDTIHTFIERKNYKGLFLPGYKPHANKEIFNDILSPVEFEFVDHVVGNQGAGDMEPTAQWYEKMLDFHRFWSVDDKIMHTEYSALNSVVVADFDEVIKMPINEPAKGLRKSQIQEYVDYYNGAGVQHIALNTKDIIATITELRRRGVEFLEVPKAYYDNLRNILPKLQIEVGEDIDTLEKLKILIDYDDKGYLLQLFTKPVEDRPTLFFEFIQRKNHWGFGAGNFKSLFKAIEDEQARRGNLV